MQASAFQQLHTENKQLTEAVRQLTDVNEQLRLALQQKTLEVHGERVSNMITALATAIHAPAHHQRRWWHRWTRRVAAHLVELPTTASVVVPQALIDEVGQNPHRYASATTKDAAAGTQTFTVTKKPQAEIDVLDAKIAEQVKAIEAAQKAAADAAAAPPIVGLDGQTPAREATGKILTVSR